jgi:hypothetical protein
VTSGLAVEVIGVGIRCPAFVVAIVASSANSMLGVPCTSFSRLTFSLNLEVDAGRA